MNCPTVKIKTESGPVIINQSDYDSSIHTLYDAATTQKKPSKKAAK
jgi:hypothetical protein